MSWAKWSPEGQLKIDESSEIFQYLWYLGSNNGSKIYAYKSQIREGNHREYRLLIKRLSQLGGSDDPHLIIHLNTKAYPPIQAWHYTDKANGKRIGAVESYLLDILMTALVRYKGPM